ncbi:hypothetical protein VTK73DRAFT_5940 [Phialemonium thermophilum]|uniref:Chitin-binding type-1 domain-containing protein n=1 Tax=Phialemonium thermophilum TaxID=223376 RepID=A0ABR3WL56_9PEZI
MMLPRVLLFVSAGRFAAALDKLNTDLGSYESPGDSIRSAHRHAVEGAWLGEEGLHSLSVRQDGQRCGPDNGNLTCSGSDCCSMYGWCGTGPEYCNRFGCQVLYGWCEGQPLPTSTSTASTLSPTSSSASSTSSTSATTSSVSTTSSSTTITTTSSTGSTSTSSSSSSSSSAAPPVATPPSNMTITTNGLCGNTTTCSGSTSYGHCCSFWFWCGDGDAFCGEGCRPEYGSCGSAAGNTTGNTTTTASTSVTSTSTVTTPSTTGSTSSTSLTPSSSSISTTSTPSSSTTTTTTSSSTTATTPSPSPSGLVITTNGMCGNGTTCAGSSYGGCCSLYYYCGNSPEFCGTGCRSAFGTCNGTTPAPPPPAAVVSTNGMCGNGTTCAGSSYGRCCSLFYYCGSSDEYCNTGCRSEFGSCGSG